MLVGEDVAERADIRRQRLLLPAIATDKEAASGQGGSSTTWAAVSGSIITIVRLFGAQVALASA